MSKGEGEKEGHQEGLQSILSFGALCARREVEADDGLWQFDSAALAKRRRTGVATVGGAICSHIRAVRSVTGQQRQVSTHRRLVADSCRHSMSPHRS